MLTDKKGKPCGGTLFAEDKKWLLKKSRGQVACKTLRRPHGDKITTLTAKCTTFNCTRLNDIIRRALILIDENEKDQTKEAVFQRLQKAGKESLLHQVDDHDASSHHAPSADGSATAAHPPAPAGAAAAASPSVKHQPNCMACDLFNALGGGTRSPCPACGAIAAPPALAAPPAPQPPAPAAPASPAPHKEPGYLEKLYNRIMCTPSSSTVCASKSDGNGAPVCTKGGLGELQGGQESPREEQQQQQQNGSPSLLQYLLPINCQQYLPSIIVQGSTTGLPWKTKEADGSATAEAIPERAASSGPPPPSPATPVGDQAPAPVTPKDDDWAAPSCEPVEVFSADLRQERKSALPSTGSLTPTEVGIPPGLALTAIPMHTPPASSMDPTEFPSPLGFPVQLQLADAIPEPIFFPSGWEFSFDTFESYAFSFDAFESSNASDTTVDGLSA